MVHLILSFFIAAFGAPSLSGAMSIPAGAFGYALFWMGWFRLEKRSWWIPCTWFAAVQAVQLSWLCSLEYMGPFIVVVYVLVITALGLQFGLLTTLVRFPLGWMQMVSLAGFWVLMEWSRLFFLTGFPWNPLGLALAGNPFSIQFAALFGVYGLCFWVIFVNLLCLSKKWVGWAVCAILPYAYGVVHRNVFGADPGKSMSVALVQTALRPEERDFIPGKVRRQVHPFEQWDRILSYLQKSGEKEFDLIVLPEGALPCGAKNCVYPVEAVKAIWERHFGAGSAADFSEFFTNQGNVSNAFWLQGVSNHFGSEVIVGLDDRDGDDVYNAAFHFVPDRPAQMDRYRKRILIPIGEYVPFLQWRWLAKFVSEQFGIENSFSIGKKEIIFRGKAAMGIFICLEETYSDFVRKIRQAGAELFVNVTNDVWFPETRLPWHHFDHGRLRAVENGVFLLRACNTGVTAAVDCFGDTIAMFPVSDQAAGVLSAELKIRSFPTLYTWMGQWPVLLFSGGAVVWLIGKRVRVRGC